LRRDAAPRRDDVPENDVDFPRTDAMNGYDDFSEKKSLMAISRLFEIARENSARGVMYCGRAVPESRPIRGVALRGFSSPSKGEQ